MARTGTQASMDPTMSTEKPRSPTVARMHLVLVPLQQCLEVGRVAEGVAKPQVREWTALCSLIEGRIWRVRRSVR
jgi:hypothetical protein